jgi:hypothetical protein
LPIECKSYDFTFTATAYSEYAHPVPAVSNQGCLTEYHPHQKLQQSFLAECNLLQETWFADPACLYRMSNNLNLDSLGSDKSHYFNIILDPRLFAACSASSKYNEDNPLFDTATRGPFQAQFWKAMHDELATLTQEFNCWEYVPRTQEMNVLPSAWAFKIKRYLNG